MKTKPTFKVGDWVRLKPGSVGLYGKNRDFKGTQKIIHMNYHPKWEHNPSPWECRVGEEDAFGYFEEDLILDTFLTAANGAIDAKIQENTTKV